MNREPYSNDTGNATREENEMTEGAILFDALYDAIVAVCEALVGKDVVRLHGGAIESLCDDLIESYADTFRE